MTVYLSGPMTGRPDFNRAEFERVGALLRGAGYQIVDPVSEDIRVYGSWEAAIERPWQEHLARDVALVPTVEAVIVMDGWEGSTGARLEVRIARTFRIPVWRFHETYDSPTSSTWSVRAMTDDELDQVVGDTPPAPPEEATQASRESATVTGTWEPTFEVAIDSAYEGDRFVPYSENPDRHVYGTGGIKDNRGKARLDLLPTEPLIATAEILAFGAEKYQPHNWRRGLPWGDTYASLQRHLLAWNAGEDLDPETGKSHLSHAQCQLLFLHFYVLTGVGEETDTRFVACPGSITGACGLEGLHPVSDHAAVA